MSIRLNLISGYFALLLIILSFAGQSWGQYVSGDRIQCTTTTRARPNTSLTSTFDSIAVNTKGTIRGGPYAGSGNSLSWFLIRWDTLSEDRYTAEFDGSGTRLFTVYSPSAFTLSTSQQPYWNDSPPAGPVVPLQWTTSQRAQYFEIYRNGTFYVRIDNPNATSFINNSGLTPGANYTFLVAARRNDDPLSFTESNTLTLTMPTQPQAPPTVTSEAASGISTTVATMNLRVNPNGSQTNAFFQYGPTASYGNTTGAGDFGSGTSVVAGSSIYSGLQPNTTYHYRAVATNSGGTSYGNDVAFTTNPTVSPADLTPQNLSIPSPANSGGSLTLNYNIANLGSTASLPTVTKIQIKTAGGSLVQSSIFNTAQVPANSSVSESHSLSLAGISEGSYIAVVIADNFSETGQTNYSNDIATIPFNVLSPKPNLAPFTPPGWPDKLVLSTTTGTSTQTTVATVDDNLFLDVAFKNIGSVSAGRFYFVIMVDGAVRYNSVVNSLTTDQIWSYTDFELGKLPAGNHTVSIIIDSQSNIEESAEEDNIYSIPISVTGPLVPVITITNPQQGDTLTAGASNTLVTWAVSGDLTGITGFDVIFRMNGLQFDHRVVGASARFITWNVPFWLDSIPISVRVEAQGISSVSTEIGLSVAAPAPTTRIAKVRIVSGNPVTIGKPVNFSGDGSVSSDLITSYRWQFSDNSSTATTSPSVTHTFATGFENGKGWVRLVIVSGGIESKTVEKQLTLDGSGHPANTKSSTTPDPINTATGAFLAGHDLMPIHGRMLPGLLQAFYTSSSYRPAENGLTASTPGALGYGWSHSFETRIERYLEEGKRIVIVTFGDAHSEKFSFDEATNSWQSPAGIFSKLEESIDGRFALITHPQQLRHQFGSDGRLQSISDRNGNTLLILWELLPGSTDPNDKRIQRVQVPGGPSDGSATHSIEFIYQAAKPNLLWKLRDPMGHFITFTQDVNDDLVSIMDERNDPLLTTQYTYDPLHQMLTGRDAKGVQFVRNEYDANRRVIDQWDAQNNRTHLEYSADGVFPKITTITRFADSSFALTDPRNEVTKDIHDDRLRLTEQQLRIYNADGTGPFWLSTKTEYDPVTSERLKEINRRGFAAEMTYASGNLLTIKARDGGITAYAYTDPQNPTLPTLITYPDTRVMKKLEYDAHGNLLFTTFPYDPANPTANRRAMLFDAYGQMKKITDANGVSQEYFYDDWGRNDRMLDGEGKEHRYEFNDSGQRTAYVDPLLHRTEYIRNALGKITHTQQADPNDPLHPLITQVDYDENNLPILTTDPLNQLARQYHDELGRVWKEEDDQHNITQHRFDAFSREIETENAKNGITHRTFNHAGYLLRQAAPAPSTNIIDYKRDENGNAIEMTDADGVKVTAEFDPMDRQISSTRWKSATISETTHTHFNLMNQKEWDEDERGRKTYYYFDLAGNHIRTVPVPIAEQPAVEFSFGYDNEGHQTSATHDDNKTRQDFYNGRYQLKERIDELDNHEKYFYDDAGNLQRLVTHDPAGGHLEETTFVHDSLNRLIQINPPTGPPITFKYDKGNRRTEAASAAGICKWTYTTLNQVATVEGPHGLRLSFHYDPLGGTDSITYPGNRTVTYQNDAAGRFQSVTDWQGRSITQSYTLGDRPLQIQFPNGIKTDLDHDTEGRLNSLSHHKGAEPPLFSATYDYDDLGDLTSVPDFPVDTSVLSYPRTYGDANQLLTVQGTPVLHDHRGNITRAKLSPTNAATDTLTWDYANRLTAGTVGGAPFTNTFDAQSHRIATTRGGVTTGFLLDDRGAMPRIMTELDAANSPTAFYLYAGQSLLARVLPDGTISYYHGDHQGNTILMTDGTGSSAAHYQYDTFGTLVASSGPLAPSNHFRYLGGLGVRDNLDGTLDARARTYHTRFGRFLSRDALYGNQTDGQSLNRYVYALNDPYGLGDPSGFDAVSQAIYDGADFLQLTALYTADTINAPYRYGYRLLTHPVTTIKNTHPIDAWRRMGENIYGALEDQAVNGLHLPKTIDGKARLASGLLFLGVGAEGSPAAVAEEGSGIVNQIELADKFSRTPKGLMDQMVLDAAKKGAGDRIMSNLGDPKFKGMEKWSYSEVSEQGIRSEVHYVRNPATGELMDFKFKIHAETYK